MLKPIRSLITRCTDNGAKKKQAYVVLIEMGCDIIIRRVFDGCLTQSCYNFRYGCLLVVAFFRAVVPSFSYPVHIIDSSDLLNLLEGDISDHLK